MYPAWLVESVFVGIGLYTALIVTELLMSKTYMLVMTARLNELTRVLAIAHRRVRRVSPIGEIQRVKHLFDPARWRHWWIFLPIVARAYYQYRWRQTLRKHRIADRVLL